MDNFQTRRVKRKRIASWMETCQVDKSLRDPIMTSGFLNKDGSLPSSDPKAKKKKKALPPPPNFNFK